MQVVNLGGDQDYCWGVGSETGKERWQIKAVLPINFHYGQLRLYPIKESGRLCKT